MAEIRLLSVADADTFWRLRLEALEQEPRAFGMSAEEHRLTSAADMAARLSDPDKVYVMGAFVGAKLIGMAGLVREVGIKRRHKATVWGVYVGAELRGSGVGRQLMEALTAHARTLPGLERILLSVAVTQPVARSLYQTLGFVPFGTERAALKLGDEYVDEEHFVLAL